MKSKNESKVSRRRFLEATVVTAAATSTVSAQDKPVDSERRRLEQLVAEYGSELGDLRKVR